MPIEQPAQPANSTAQSQADLTNPVVVTPTAPPTQAPVVGQGPVTDSAPINVAMGASVAGATAWGMTQLTGGPEVVGTALFLNLVGQLVKRIKWFPEHEGLIALFLLASFAAGLVFFYPHSPGVPTSDPLWQDTTRLGKAFLHMANSTMEALLHYKADKASGLNIMPPTEPDKEF